MSCVYLANQLEKHFGDLGWLHENEQRGGEERILIYNLTFLWHSVYLLITALILLDLFKTHHVDHRDTFGRHYSVSSSRSSIDY